MPKKVIPLEHYLRQIFALRNAPRTYRTRPQQPDTPLDKMKFVIYVRKSSEEVGAQATSLEDQYTGCMEYAKRQGLNIVKVFRESASAKIFFNRPIFYEMLKGFLDGEYDGLLVWHVDRLSRNCIDSGVVVAMYDEYLIKNIQNAKGSNYANNADGKKALGIDFALSKEYSEHLSENVQRGLNENLKRGKSAGVHKWGYRRSDITGYYEPDEQFELIQKGWEMRVNGITIKEVLEFWQENKVGYMTKITRKNKVQRWIGMSKATASNLFKDPFYYGILKQSEQMVDLREVTPNFKPMITEEAFKTVQEMSYGAARYGRGRRKNEASYPFKGLVHCAECGSVMRVGKSRSCDGSHYLYYRCDNKECPVKNVRAKVLFDDLYEQLDNFTFTDDDYSKYNKAIMNYTEEQMRELRQQEDSLKGTIKQQQSKVDEIARQIASLRDDTPESVKKVLLEDLKKAEGALGNSQKRLQVIEAQIVDPEQIKMKAKDFLNLANSVADKMRADSAIEKDELAKILLLNIELSNKKEPSYLWKEPFATLLKSRKINSGAPD